MKIRIIKESKSKVLKEGEDPTVDLVAAGLDDVLEYRKVPYASRRMSGAGKKGMVHPGAEFSDKALGLKPGQLPFNAVIGLKSSPVYSDYPSMEVAKKYASRLNQLKDGKYVYGVRRLGNRVPMIYVYPVMKRVSTSQPSKEDAYKALGMPTE